MITYKTKIDLIKLCEAKPSVCYDVLSLEIIKKVQVSMNEVKFPYKGFSLKLRSTCLRHEKASSHTHY